MGCLELQQNVSACRELTLRSLKSNLHLRDPVSFKVSRRGVANYMDTNAEGWPRITQASPCQVLNMTPRVQKQDNGNWKEAFVYSSLKQTSVQVTAEGSEGGGLE